MAFGPFIAIASPQDQMPQLGAPRFKLADNNWHEFVKRRVVESQ
jgi:hypothetical protein